MLSQILPYTLQRIELNSHEEVIYGCALDDRGRISVGGMMMMGVYQMYRVEPTCNYLSVREHPVRLIV